ncbi:MAG: hypothetical protein PF488_00510 [Patescibacteria group bacterium]|jgi:hypothetical protein|nr:hypothetical protein [Patescibacteria group bacterium]
MTINKLQTARYYKLGFNNNLQLVTTYKGLEWMGTDRELDAYNKQLSEEKPTLCELCGDVFYSNEESEVESIKESGMCNNCAYKHIK